MNSSFDALGLSEALVRAVADLGYTQPTPIQLQAIPVVLAGGDLMAGAQTGTGKTARSCCRSCTGCPPPPAMRRSAHRAPRVLILAPTRELAAQVEESVRDVRQAPARQVRGHLRRRLDQPADRRAEARRRHRRRHARPAARPRRPAHRRSLEGRGARARRSRSHARHGLPARHEADVRAAAQAAADAAVLGDLSPTKSVRWRPRCCTTRHQSQATPRNSTVEAVDQKCISVDEDRQVARCSRT